MAPIDKSDAAIDPLGSDIITTRVAMKAPIDIILNDILNQCSFSMRTGNIIELIKPTKTNVAPKMLVYTEVYPNPSIKKLMMAPRQITEPFITAKMKKITLKFEFCANSLISFHIFGKLN